MAVVKIYDIEGKELQAHEIPLSYEKRPGDEQLFAKSIKRQLANARENCAHAKKRGEVSGGGAKPWRQKGTGRSRHGTSRSPLWEGGAVIFGPGNRNFSIHMNKKERKRAMVIGLMSKIISEDFLVVDGLALDEPSIKEGSRILSNLQINDKKILFLASRDEDLINRSFRNIKGLECLPADRVNGFALLKNEKVLATRKAYEHIEEVWLS